MKQDISKIRELMLEYADPLPEEIDGRMQLIADLGFNSLTLFEMVNDAEEKYSVRFEDSEIAEIVTVDDFIDLLDSKNISL